jgi:cation:H+ antiporter
VSALATPALILVFAVAAIATWVAGLFLSDGTEMVDERFNLGEALGGLILLGLAGTLPEIAITVTAALNGHLGLATGNLLGGIAMQTLVLVLLDATSGGRTPLSTLSHVLEPIVEALLVIAMMSLALLGPLLPASVAIGSVSPISILLAVTWLGGLVVIQKLSKDERWQAAREMLKTAVVAPAPAPAARVRPNRFQTSKTAMVIAAFAAASAVTLIAGVVLAQSGNALANRWGISGVIFGATILAGVTALPEISTGIRAVRLGHVGLAMGDIFGGNQVQLTLFLVADLLAGQPVLHSVSTSSTWLGGMGAIVTAIFAVGLVVRPRRKVLGVGPDSLLVVLAYALGIWGLAVIAS